MKLVKTTNQFLQWITCNRNVRASIFSKPSLHREYYHTNVIYLAYHIPYSPKCLCAHMWRVFVTIIFTNEIFVVRQVLAKNVKFIAGENLGLYGNSLIIMYTIKFNSIALIMNFAQHVKANINTDS